MSSIVNPLGLLVATESKACGVSLGSRLGTSCALRAISLSDACKSFRYLLMIL